MLTIDGQPIENRQDAQRIIYGQAGQEISIELKRGNQQLTVPVTPRVNPPRDEGPTGIRLCTECQVLAQRAVSYPLWEAFPPSLAPLVLVGPEGGWSDEEIELARCSGWQIVTLGGRTLRADTAAIAVVTLLQNRFGDLD